MSKPEWQRWPWLSWCVVAATLICCQSIVASGVSRPRLAVLLPMGHRDAELRHNFLQGFRLGQASVEACGELFQQSTGKAPSSLAGAGFDAARLLAVADAAPLPFSANGGIDAMGWLDPDQREAVPICQAFEERRRGEHLRLKAVASDSRFRDGLATSGQAMAGLIE